MRSGFLFLALFFSVSGIASEARSGAVTSAEFVWSVETAEGSGLFHSSYTDSGWSEQQSLYFDRQLNILPAIALAGNGEAVVAWSSVYSDRIQLKVMRKSGGQWGDTQILFEANAVNLAPVVLADSRNSFWIFWSSNDGDDDDIMVSSSGAGGWSDPALVHPSNGFPDGLPEAGFDHSGNIWVEWQSLRDGVLQTPIRMFDVSDDSRSIEVPDVDALRENSLTEFHLDPPVFFQSRSRASMYLPEDRNLPARLFRGNLLP